ncbi:peptidase [Neobacillus notoginsengisoli]|uniref:Peptidase n=1 Tax=Neobacillus notoginsengisoli TaxID=1578198 RepID=A0A417YVC3_9BACI|nr:DUF5590 domain-containing protein [Neobacillus notoginsengisoli]RHW41277.1 peptidase [Neobacillus notoginsengisoli]
MKKFFIGLAVFLAIAAGIAGWIYSNATSPIRAAEKKATEIAMQEAELTDPHRFHVYYGKETVFVVEGKNKKGDEIIVWIPEKEKTNNEKKAIVRLASNGVTKNEAIRMVQAEKKPKKVISTRLGMEDGIPFWEVYYTGEDKLMNYYCINFDTGKLFKLIENL